VTKDEQQKITAAATILRRLEQDGLAAEQGNVTAAEWDQIAAGAEAMLFRLVDGVADACATDDDQVVIRDMARKGIVKVSALH
jgi:hypothetical protein